MTGEISFEPLSPGVLRRVKIKKDVSGVKMKINFKPTYHPSVVMEKKRKALEEQREKSTAEKVASDAKEEQAELAMTPVNQAEAFLKDSKALLAEFLTYHQELTNLTNEALNVALDDIDRKKLQAKFNDVRAKVDATANKELQGTKIFSGEFSENGKQLVLNAERKENLVIRMDDLSAKGLKIDRIKIDSLVNARKAVQDLETAKGALEQSISSIISKFQLLDFHKKKEETRNKEAGIVTGPQVEESTETGGPELKGWRKFFYEDLKKRQAEMASVTGQDIGLLIKLTG